jgi:methylated-DNA-protein-cysteine methyltransferase-like protein
MDTKFSQAVVNIVRQVPHGRVVSYGQVAAYANVPRAARAVGWTLKRLETAEMPWWRVINNAGRISIKGNWFNTPEVQRELLRKEGVGVGEDFSIDIQKYRFVASPNQLKIWGLDEDYLRWLDQKFKIGY